MRDLISFNFLAIFLEKSLLGLLLVALLIRLEDRMLVNLVKLSLMRLTEILQLFAYSQLRKCKAMIDSIACYPIEVRFIRNSYLICYAMQDIPMVI